MRQLRAAAAAETDVHRFQSPPASATSAASKEPTITPHESWRPYSNSKDFEANATIIVIILFCALVCALAINAAVRCLLRRRTGDARSRPPEPKATGSSAPTSAVAATTLVYSAGVSLAGAAAECAICLTEFADGEEIRVLDQCKHGFHGHCVQGWLSSHSSCPTCRASCLQASSAAAFGEVPRQPHE